MEETSEELPNFSIGIDLLRPDPTSSKKKKAELKKKNSQVARLTNLSEDQLQQILAERHSQLGTEKTSIDGFHSDVIRLQSQKSEVLRILIYTRLKINKKNKSLYKFPASKHVSFRKYRNMNLRVFTVRDTKIGMLSH